jgi:hypothetical protein
VEGDKNTGWVPNQKELKNSSTTIDDDSVNINTRSFGLTLRDTNNDEVLEMNADNTGFESMVVYNLKLTGNVTADRNANIDTSICVFSLSISFTPCSILYAFIILFQCSRSSEFLAFSE